MLIATFGPSTGWVGKKITRDGDAFVLEGHGVITAKDVMEYDRQGHLVWSNDGTRAWVAAAANAPSPPAGAPASDASVPDSSTGSQASVGAVSHPAIVDIKRVTRGDWVVGGGFLVLLLGTSLAWYTWSGSFLGARVDFVDTGWTSAAGWLSFLAGLAALVVVILASGVLPQLHIDFHRRVPLIVIGLGGLASVIVLIRLVAGPGASSGFGVGIFLSLLGAVAVAVGGVLKRGEPTPVVAPSKASAAVDNAMNSAKVALGAARNAVTTQKDAQTQTQAQTTVVEPLRESPVSAEPSTATPHISVADEIAKLADLHAKGSLTDAEFAALKAKLTT